MKNLNILKNIFRKSFQIDLDDKYCYPNDKEFVMADSRIIKIEIERYCAKNNQTVAFLTNEKPIIFLLNGKEKYTAFLKMGYGRYNQGYHIHCLELLD